MRNATYAIYKGGEYEVSYGKNDMVYLHSYEDIGLANGFYLREKNHYIKYVHKNELDELYRIVTKARYHNYEFQAFKQEGEMVLLYASGGNGLLCEQLHFKQINKCEWERWVNIKDIERIWEEKTNRLSSK